MLDESDSEISGDFFEIFQSRRTIGLNKEKGSSGSIDGFAGMKTDDKHICIFEQLHKNYDKIRELETEKTSYREEVNIVREGFSKLSHRVVKMEELCETQRWIAKVLAYKYIDTEARSMRNNIMIYGLTENFRYNTKTLVLNFLESELDIDTSEMCIERAHRLGQVHDTKYRGRQDPKCPMVVRFRDYLDTETILSKAYKLRGTYCGVDRQFPKEISIARTQLYNSNEAREVRAKHQKLQLRYPAKLSIDGKCVRDALPDWFKVLGTARLKETRGPDPIRERAYSESTVIDETIEVRKTDESTCSEVFETRSEDELSVESGNAHKDVNNIESRDQVAAINRKSVEEESVIHNKGNANALPVQAFD